jgi:hypothetical protein
MIRVLQQFKTLPDYLSLVDGRPQTSDLKAICFVLSCCVLAIGICTVSAAPRMRGLIEPISPST